MENDLEKLKYPIGRFLIPETITNEMLSNAISEIAQFPERLRTEVEFLSKQQLQTRYRPGGWTIRQVVHHCADSHMNCLIRIKLALTEESPVIKPYFEDRWSEGFDNLNLPIEPSLQLLEGLHFRLAYIMKNLSEEDLLRTFIHPEHDKKIALNEIICTYAWHCNHHLAHIKNLKMSRNW